MNQTEKLWYENQLKLIQHEISNLQQKLEEHSNEEQLFEYQEDLEDFRRYENILLKHLNKLNAHDNLHHKM